VGGEPLSRLLCCPVPPSFPVLEAPPDCEDGLLVEDSLPGEPDPDESPVFVGAVAPPLGDVDVLAGGSEVVGVLPPVAVGGASEYWMPLESA
jgi:hypothetical protein